MLLFRNTEATPAGVVHLKRKTAVVLICRRVLIFTPLWTIFKTHCLACLSKQFSKSRCHNDLSSRTNLFGAFRRVAERAPLAGWPVQTGQPARGARSATRRKAPNRF